ncbi:MAG: teichoic acid ABC transporter permease [Desulfuromonas sp.]|nr:MAG: teichoic acid ABC transporter permease [Desulfuromonas sp.]
MFSRFIGFLAAFYEGRRLILQLTVSDFKSRYLGSYLGLIWAFVQPLVTIVILWFVFEVGFKSAPVGDLPFALWLISGIVPWFFVADTLVSGSGSIVDNSYLVKKIVFRVSFLPIVKLFSALIVHVTFVFVIFIVFYLYGRYPTIYGIQVVYYSFSSIALLFGLTLLSSSLMVFLKDMREIVSILVQFGFWLTPIFWSLTIVPEKYHKILKLNPVYYIIEGYRDSLINNRWFWEHPTYTLYFWGFTLFVFLLGSVVFIRLRPHFADVL